MIVTAATMPGNENYLIPGASGMEGTCFSVPNHLYLSSTHS